MSVKANKHYHESLPIRVLRHVAAFSLLSACIWFIWSNSLQSAELSAFRSQKVAEILGKVMSTLFGADNVLTMFAQTHVRKIAHAVEFAMLGITLELMLLILGRLNGHNVAHAAFIILAVAVADETIQIFTGRGASVSDIVLDFAGGLAGLVLALVVYGILRLLFGRSGAVE